MALDLRKEHAPNKKEKYLYTGCFISGEVAINFF
jgi:hypothetical protein